MSTPPVPTTTTDVVVIGAGLAGLAAAATAAGRGATVTVLEARAEPGGRARTDHAHGFSLNQGPHALYAGLAGDQVLRSLGVDPRGGLPPARGWGRHDGELVRLPLNPLDVVRSPLVGVRGTTRLGRLLARPRALLATPTAGRSMAEWIHEHAPEPDAAAVLTTLTRVATYVDDPAEIDAGAALANLVAAATTGVRYLDGGWGTLVDGLRSAAVAAGATVVTADKVEAVTSGAGGVTAHTARFDVRAGAVVIAAGGPGHVDRLLGGASDAVAGWAATARPVHAASLDVGLRRLPVDQHRFVLGIEDPLYLSVHTPTADLAPDGGEVVHVMRYGDASADPRHELDELLDQAQPGWRDEVVAERYGRRLVVAHGRPEPGAGLAGRPGPVVPDLAGVAVAGDWVGPDGLLADAALASGAAAGRRAADRATGRRATVTT